MKILIVYATYSSGTQVAATLIEETLKETGNEVSLKNAKDVDPQELKNFDLVVVGSPSWFVEGVEGQPHQYFFDLFKKIQNGSLAGKKFAVFGLGHSAYYAIFCGAVDKLEEWIKNAKGSLISDSLKIDGFYFNQAKNEQLLKDWAKNLTIKPS